MAVESSFAVVMNRLRGGDQQAASEVFGKFLDRLIALANRQCEARMRSKYDPEDVIQSVYMSFIKRFENAPFELADWGNLWAILAMITIRKCHDRRQFWRASRRDATREITVAAEPDESAWWEAIDRGPTPLQALVLAETMEELIAHQNPLHQTIAELTFHGYTGVEIARRCDCSERSVYRVVSRLRDRLNRMDEFESLA